MTYRRYGGGGNDVLDYLYETKYRQNQQLRDLLNQFVLIRQLKEERAERERDAKI